jgi:HPt (histidine-containing phosphotransfer) domain-containing protein
MTANAMQGDREICLAAGMDEYVSKPIRIESLVNALSKSRPLDSTWLEPPAQNAPASRRAPPVIDSPTVLETELDRRALNNLLEVVGGEFSYLVEVIDSFLEDAPKLLAELQAAVANGDTGETRRIAHSLKSNGADFGAQELSKLCAQLEERARSGSLDGAPELAARIAAEYKYVAAQLKEIKSNGSIN